MKGRAELDVGEVGKAGVGVVYASGARSDLPPTKEESGRGNTRNEDEAGGNGGGCLRSQSGIISPVSPMESSPEQRTVQPAAGNEAGNIST